MKILIFQLIIFSGFRIEVAVEGGIVHQIKHLLIVLSAPHLWNYITYQKKINLIKYVRLYCFKKASKQLKLPFKCSILNYQGMEEYVNFLKFLNLIHFNSQRSSWRRTGRTWQTWRPSRGTSAPFPTPRSSPTTPCSSATSSAASRSAAPVRDSLPWNLGNPLPRNCGGWRWGFRRGCSPSFQNRNPVDFKFLFNFIKTR